MMKLLLEISYSLFCLYYISVEKDCYEELKVQIHIIEVLIIGRQEFISNSV